jgi:hypothetical protein
MACIPPAQNSHQGGVMGSFFQKTNLQQGDQFVVSIECDEVLGTNSSKRDKVYGLWARDVIPTSSGSPGAGGYSLVVVILTDTSE